MSEGGYLVPKIAYIDKPKSGKFWRGVRWFGYQFVKFGARIKSFGYYQREIHPYDEIMEMMKKAKVRE